MAAEQARGRSTWRGARSFAPCSPASARASTCSSSRCTTSSPTAGRSACSLRELATLYRAFAAGRRSPLPELPIQYADFAAWQRRSAGSRRGAWKHSSPTGGSSSATSRPSSISRSTDRRPALQTYRGARHALLIPDLSPSACAAVGEREGATLFMTSLAAFQALLWRYTGQEDFIVGTPIANRTHAATEKLIGFFANTLVLRADLSGDPSFRTLLGRVRATALGAYAHQDLPFEKLVEELQPARHPDRTPLFQVMFAFQSSTEPPGEFAPGLTAERLPLDNETAKFDLTLYLSRTARGLESAWQYNTDLFEPGTIERMAGHFRTLLEGIVAHPDRRLSRLPLVSDAERRQLLAAGCDTAHPPLPIALPASCSKPRWSARPTRSPRSAATSASPIAT